LREGKHRRRSGRFLIDGMRELDRAMQAGIRVLELFTDHTLIAHENVNESVIEHVIENVIVRQVTESVMQKISFGDRNEGIVAVAEEPVQSFEIFEAKIGKKACPLLAVLEGIEKPGNLGAVFRSADAAGVDGVMIVDSPVDPFHSNSIRSSMGTVFSIPMVCTSSVAARRWLEDHNIQIAAAWCHAAWCGRSAMPYTSLDFCRPTAIVLGSEAEGLTDLWNDEGIIPVTLPMLGIADSLNVSVAAGILFYEVRRQRRLVSEPSL